MSVMRPLLLLLPAFLLSACDQDKVASPECLPVSGRVASILDGDTIQLDDGTKVRYLLVDTPETDLGDCYAEEAKQLNALLVLGREITLTYDNGLCYDGLNRNLAYVWIGDHLINRVLLERGYARVLVVRPSGHPGSYLYEQEFLGIQQRAQAERAGLWGFCP